MSDISIDSISDRMRYESFSRLADSLAKANTIESIRVCLQQNIKFIVSSYSYLFGFLVEDQIVEFGFNSDMILRKNALAHFFEDIDERPVVFIRDDIPSTDDIVNNLFENVKNRSIVRICGNSEDRAFVAYCGTKEDIGYNISDYRFIKLVSEVVLPKLRSILLRDKISFQNQELKKSFSLLEIANRELNSSIDYAQIIQSALLPSKESIQQIFDKNFVLFEPRDKVSGDFYFSYERDGYRVIMAADCTGHGVPGAILSIFGIQILREICRDIPFLCPDKILEQLDSKFQEYLLNGVSKTESQIIDDGMDIAVVTISTEKNELRFASANRPLIYFNQNKEVTTIKGARCPIGSRRHHQNKQFEIHTIDYSKGDRFYIFSDGYVDQFGGERSKKYGSKRLINTLENIQEMSIEEHCNFLSKELADWKGHEDQIDDILLIGVEL